MKATKNPNIVSTAKSSTAGEPSRGAPNSEPALIQDDRLAVSIKDAARLIGIGRTKLYELLDNGQLQNIRLGSRRLILMDALRKLLADHVVP